MSLIDDYKNGKRYGTDWQAPSFQHMNDLVGTVSDADDKADNALSKSTTAESNSSTALTKATTAETNSTNAVNTANTANSNSQAAVTTANGANTKSDQAINTANDANSKATNAETTANNLTQAPDVSEANKFGIANVEIIGTETNKKFKFSNLKGNGIATIAKTGSNGLQDIYTITFDNGGTFSFNVTNGKGITNISKTNTSGLVDTYTITYNDESTSIFTITNGDSIELRVENGYFQWKYTTSSTWNNLISLGELSNVDQELSETSTNAIANSAVTQALNNKSTITVNDIVQTTINFDSDPQTQIDNIVNNTTKIQNQNGGFSAGDGASAISGGGAVGYNASANYGGAVGYGAKVGNGFAGGYNAKAQDTEGNYIDAIQLGTGTNITERTLKIYNDNIYNANTHTLTVRNATVGGNEVVTIREDGEVEHGTSGQNGYYHFWYKIYSDGTIVVHGVYYTNTDAEITIPFKNFSFRSIDYFRCAFGSIDDAEYSNGAFAKSVRTTYITFASRSAAQWYSFYLYEQGL